MGTKHLTMVILNNETKIAQYGQWDGYPEGQGVTVLNFLKKSDLKLFKDKLQFVRFKTEEDQQKVNDFLTSIGCKSDLLNSEQVIKYNKIFPYSSRGIGAKILELIQNSNDSEIVLVDSTDFASDSDCEWAYVIDFDKKVLEVYERLDETSLTRIKLVAGFELNKLPSKKAFIDTFKVKEIKKIASIAE